MKQKESKWEETGRGNSVLHFRGGYISYNPDIQGSFLRDELGIGGVAQMIGTAMGLETKNEETALYLKKDNSWRILNGDFRRQYEKCKTIKERLAVYEKNKSKKSDWSTK